MNVANLDRDFLSEFRKQAQSEHLVSTFSHLVLVPVRRSSWWAFRAKNQQPVKSNWRSCADTLSRAMEFRFDLNELFKQPIVEVGNTLIPPGFTGDKRALWDVQSKMSQIVNAIGEASAHAQGLSKPITTADRLRNSEYKLYLLMDPTANNGKGAVTGMLKTGTKGLYVFDRNGQHYQVSPQCVLDFYIHESRQRTGLGRRLFEHMLQRQQIEPEKMAIDRPSDKFLGFLSKHYGLNAPVKQMNNYVVYDGFFPKTHETPAHVDVDKSNPVTQKQSANGLQQGGNSILPSQTYGRYGAAHRPCSMGQIIHNDSAVVHRNKEPTGPQIASQ
uniref:Alpha-tubulin N-acetyltransferase n=1 Tax=Dendroctonus ponderosae TaxID=77166 RepID=A0AAR5PZG7_DENPD